jgi:cytidyltransferase-like protein
MNSRELYLLCVKENGISEADFSRLGRKEKSLLLKRDGRYFLHPAERQKFTVVLTGGAFDVLHIGHVLTLQKARELGDVLVVIVATNETVEKRKGKKPIHQADYRALMVSALRPVDRARAVRRQQTHAVGAARLRAWLSGVVGSRRLSLQNDRAVCATVGSRRTLE